jgi:hypothetical protein
MGNILNPGMVGQDSGLPSGSIIYEESGTCHRAEKIFSATERWR